MKAQKLRAIHVVQVELTNMFLSRKFHIKHGNYATHMDKNVLYGMYYTFLHYYNINSTDNLRQELVQVLFVRADVKVTEFRFIKHALHVKSHFRGYQKNQHNAYYIVNHTIYTMNYCEDIGNVNI